MIKLKGKIGIALILAGFLIIGGALWARWSTVQKEKAMIDTFNKVVDEYQDQGSQEVSTQEPQKVPENMIGIMTIPKISLTVPLVDGIDSVSLKYAVGRFTETAMPGEKGNCAVAGHRSFTYNQYFNRLNEVEAGDLITVKTQKGEFKYVVYEKKIVEPTDLSVLENTGEFIMTLITCHPERSSAFRLIVRGRLS